MVIKKIFPLIFLCFGTMAWTAEVDNFTGRFNDRLKDSKAVFNKNTVLKFINNDLKTNCVFIYQTLQTFCLFTGFYIKNIHFFITIIHR